MIIKTDLAEVSDIFTDSEIISQSDHGGMLITEVQHPIRGKLTTIQGGDDGFLIIPVMAQ